jgi:hypothetical protein
MNTDPISAVSGSFSGDSIKRFSASIREDLVDLSKIDAPAPSGAYLTNKPKIEQVAGSSSMNLENLRNVVSDGLQSGFIRKQLDVAAARLADFSKPGSLITHGDLKKDMLMIGDRYAVAEAFSKAANKTAESIMVIVKS